HQYFLEGFCHFRCAAARFDVRYNFCLNGRKTFRQNGLQPRRVGQIDAGWADQGRRTGAHDHDVELLRLVDGGSDTRQAGVGVYQVRCNSAVGALGRERGAHARQDDQRYDAQRPHASPPARSASGGFERDPGLRPSIFLYHEINAAAAHIMAMPSALTSTWTNTASESSL